MNVQLEELVFKEEGIDYAKLCLDVTVYWRGSMFERVEGVIDFYQQAIELIGPHLRFYETDSMERAKPLRKDSLDLLPFWLRSSKAKRDIYILKLEGGENPNEPSEYSFLLNADEEEDNPIGVVRLMLPIDFIAKSPEVFVDLVVKLVRSLDFESGHCGFALNWDPEGEMEVESDQAMSFISKRFPGIDLSDLDVTLVAMQNANSAGIKCINWLTVLGEELTESVGGITTVEQTLPSTCKVLKLATGMLIRAGEKPDVGDQNRGVKLKCYHDVGKLLAHLRITDHHALFGAKLGDAETTTKEWLARFDD